MVRQAIAQGADRRAAGWNAIPAVRDGNVYEVKSTYILATRPGVAD